MRPVNTLEEEIKRKVLKLFMDDADMIEYAYIDVGGKQVQDILRTEMLRLRDKLDAVEEALEKAKKFRSHLPMGYTMMYQEEVAEFDEAVEALEK